MKRKNGFTLIELLAVIIILGILMIIAIPSVTNYIGDSRKSAYVDTAKQLVSGARNLVNEGKLEMYNKNATYYMPISCINSENSVKSPYGAFDAAYVVVTFNGNGYNYYWVSRDETGQGVKQAKKASELVEDDIVSDIEEGYIKANTLLEKTEEIKILDQSDCKTFKDSEEAFKYKCIIASDLHTKTCELTSGGCFASGYRDGGSKGTKTITFGKKVNSTTLTPGFAYDCDVNGDGTYNPNTERFYYINTIDDKAVLFSSNNFEGSSGQQNVNIFPYNDFEDKLPTVEQWGNVDTTFEDKAGRLLTLDEVRIGCNNQNVITDGGLDNCVFFMENTKYESNNAGRTAIWIQKEGSTLYRIQSNSRRILSVNNSSTSGVRPVVEILLSSIEPYIPGNIKYTVTFNTQGGNDISSIQVNDCSTVNNLPIPTKTNAYFGGWYTSEGFNTIFTKDTTVTSDITLYAKWVTNPVAQINQIYYATMQDAINSVAGNNIEVTIKLLKNISENVSVGSSQNVKFDLQNYTMSSSSNPIIVNEGTITIYNGTISCSASSGAINNNTGGLLNVTGGRIEATGGKQAIYNDGGTLNISGNAYLYSTSSNRATVQNTNKIVGTVTITGGTIISTNNVAVKNESTVMDSLIIGTQNNSHNITSPVLQGKTNGLSIAGTISFYDGIIKGANKAVDNISRITKTETGTTKVEGTETIDGVTYKTLIYKY